MSNGERIQAEVEVSGGRPPWRSLVALGCGALALLIWLANVLEVTLLAPHACSIRRMQYESYLMMARALVVVLPVGGLLFAAFARRESPRLRAAGLITCALALFIVVAFLRRWVPALHMPCLRD